MLPGVPAQVDMRQRALEERADRVPQAGRRAGHREHGAVVGRRPTGRPGHGRPERRRMASAMSATAAASRPSLMLGTHSMMAMGERCTTAVEKRPKCYTRLDLQA